MSRNHEKPTEKLCGWLQSFADQRGRESNTPFNFDPISKSSDRLENILDIVGKNKKTAIEERIAEYRSRIGLDLIDTLEKEGKNEEKKTTASYIPLSFRDKKAQVNSNDTMDKIKQYVDSVVKNRNGAITTPAILDQLENYLKVDKDWIRENYDEIKQVVDNAHSQFPTKVYNDVSVNDLARTDSPKEDKEPPLFQPPVKPQ